MASIAYVTDRNMIEYHRINGNRTINFWKPSSQKKMNDFKVGDYLFFLAKGTEKGITREKGIIGYGKLEKIRTMAFEKMWYEYKTMNGYASKNQLSEAIMKVTKDHTIPKTLQCMQLKDVTFFQAPIYLSEFDITLSKQIESYTYIDREDTNVTSLILKKAEEFGMDLWTMVMNDEEPAFAMDSILYEIKRTIEKYKSDFFNEREERLNRQYANKIIKSYPQYELLSENDNILIEQNDNKIIVWNVILLNKLQMKKRIHYIISSIAMHQFEFHKKTTDIKSAVMFQISPEDEYLEILDYYKIPYRILSEEELIDDISMDDDK